MIDYLKSLRSSATRESYFTVLSRFFSLHPEPQSIVRRDIEEFRYQRFPDPHRKKMGELSKATQNQRVSIISSFYRYASAYIPEGKAEPLWQKPNPANGIMLGKPEQSPKGLTPQEMELLFSQISTTSEIGLRDRAALLLIFWSSRRRSEISDLRFGDIQPASFPNGQGGMRQGWIFSFRGKAHKSERDSQELVPIVKEAIDWYLIASGRSENIQPGDPLFTSVAHGKERPLSASTLAKRMAFYSHRVGIRASLHTLRHTAAKARYESGEDILSIQALLRHSSLNTTYVYLKRLTGTADPGYSRLLDEYGHL